MMRINTGRIPLAVCSAVSLAVPLASQTQSTPLTTSTTVADVYVQTHSGVYVYHANGQDQLSLVSGSPFAETGQMEGVNGAYLITVGTDFLHTYHVESNGAVGSAAGEINTQSYGGAQCGTTSGPALLDHTGQYFAVDLHGASSGTACSALQTYKIGSGQFTFLGDSESTNNYHGQAFQTNVVTYSSNNLFAYGVQAEVYANVFIAYKRSSAGDLVVDSQFTETSPTPSASDGGFFPILIVSDPNSHLAAVMNTPFGSSSTVFQLASFTINNTTGSIASTNSYTNMPVVQGYPSTLGMSWAGNLLAVGGSAGLQLFHFNGAAPPTKDGNILVPNTQIDAIAWDKSNHLYALNYANSKLYVFNVSTTGVATQAAGSPHTVSGAYGYKGMIVVPKS